MYNCIDCLDLDRFVIKLECIVFWLSRCMDIFLNNIKELRDTTNFFLKNTYKSLQDLFSGSHYIETKKMASLIFLFSNILAREGVIIEQKSRKIA